MEANCEREVRELHAFFQDWFTGRLAPVPTVFSRFADTLAADFEIVVPSGVTMRRDDLVTGLRSAHGSHAPGFRIRIENVRPRPLGGGLWLVHYEEWQHQPGETKGRQSTALFREVDDAPNGLVWVHVHETWLPRV